METPNRSRRFGTHLVREIALRIDEVDDQFELLDTIDRIIVSDDGSQPRDKTVREAIPEILRKSMDCLRAKRANAFVVINDHPPRVFPGQEDWRLPPAGLDGKLNEFTYFAHDNGSTFVVPFRVELSSKGDRRNYLTVSFAYWAPFDYNFRSDEARRFADALAQQCTIMLKHWVASDLERARRNIVNKYFATRLNEEKRWHALAENFLAFMPTWEPAGIDQFPKVQILTYEGDESSIILRNMDQPDGGTRTFVDEKILLVSQTICGLLVEAHCRGEQLDFLYVDPTEETYRGRYSAYLLDEMPKSELVIPIYDDNQLLGMVNLEHKDAGAFSPVHIAMLRKGAAEIAPMVAALLHEEVQERRQTRQHLYVLHRILEKLARTYRHKIGQHVQIAKLAVDGLADLADSLTGSDKKFFDRLTKAVGDFFTASDAFVKHLPDYVNFGRVAIFEEAQRVFNEFDPNDMEAMDGIAMTFACDIDEKTEVYASALVREHIYNLLKNSLDEVRRRRNSNEIETGFVSMRLCRKSRSDRFHKSDSIDLIVVEISDNGGGLTKENEKKFGTFGWSSKDEGFGSGFGVASAIEFLNTIGGEFSFKNDHPDGLSVQAAMEVFTPEIHDQRAKKANEAFRHNKS